MYELNEQELEQVAGGHNHYVTYGSAGEAVAEGSAIIGGGASQAASKTFVNGNHTVSTAAGQIIAVGLGADASSAATTAGSFYQQ
jgi:hypothetical protein